MIKIEIPQKAKNIIDKLEQAGYEAYVVGGPVRDSILGKNPMDWDITTSASPSEVKEIFSYTIDTGIEHGTVTVMIDHEPFEVTTYRIDGKYTDHRRPEEVAFTKSLKEDLLRRDFTINAMAYNPKTGLVDMYEGMADLQKKVIRCVGDANQRFDEDALRILRALRFKAQLNFEIEEATAKAIESHGKFLVDISAERIQVELTKMLLTDHPETMLDAYYLGVTKYILPEFDVMMDTEQNNPHHKYNVGMHTIKAMQHIPADSILRWTMLLHDVGKPKARIQGKEKDSFIHHQEIGEEMARMILRRLKFDNQTVKEVTKLVLWHDQRFNSEKEVNKRTIRRWANKLGKDLFAKMLVIQQADILAQSDYHYEEKQMVLNRTKELFEEIVKDEECLTLKELAIDGKDLMELGMKPGKDMGLMLNHLLDRVLQDPELNTKETLRELVLEKRKSL